MHKLWGSRMLSGVWCTGCLECEITGIARMVAGIVWYGGVYGWVRNDGVRLR